MNFNSNINESIRKGLFGGIASVSAIFTYPLEVIKVRLQVFEKNVNQTNLICKMIHAEGFRCLFKGLNLYLITGFIGYGSLIFNYNFLFNLNKKVFTLENRVFTSVLSSFEAGIITSTIASPLHLIRTKLILLKNNNTTSLSKLIKEIYLEKGLVSFWRALNTSYMLCFYNVIQICLYDNMNYYFNREARFSISMLEGFLSRAIACVAVYPFNLLRSRMLNFHEDKLKLFEKEQIFNVTSKYYLKIFSSFHNIYKSEGVLALYRGMQYEVLKVGINGALFFVTLEFLNKNLSL